MTSANKSQSRRRSNPVVDAFWIDVDRSFSERSLRLTVEERFDQLMELQRLIIVGGAPATTHAAARPERFVRGIPKATLLPETDWINPPETSTNGGMTR